MPTFSIDNYHGPSLRLVASLPRSSAEMASKRILDRPRCRPGELPVTVRITPDARTLRAVVAEAEQLGITAELWARLVVDSQHVLAALEGSGATRGELVTTLDRAATATANPAVQALTETNAAYVHALRSRRGASAPMAELELLVPEDTAGAWRLSAITEGQYFDNWLAQSLAQRRNGVGAVLDWEIAAAGLHLSLREWCYAAWAKR